MNTFVPDTDFDRCAALLLEIGGAKRLNKQIAEGGQMLRIINRIYMGEVGVPWSHHPAVMMWVGYDDALFTYLLACENLRTGSPHKEILRSLDENPEFDPLWRQIEVEMPPWWGNCPIHDSHLAVLRAKRAGLPREDYKHLYYWPIQVRNGN